MRIFIAALLGATAGLPALAHANATPVIADPTDAAASVPALNTPSFFADYRPYREQKAPGWQALNRAVTNSSGMAGMSHGQMHPAGPDDHNDEHGSHHEEQVK